ACLVSTCLLQHQLTTRLVLPITARQCQTPGSSDTCIAKNNSSPIQVSELPAYSTTNFPLASYCP
ncbi:MAG TPA: hypothetical protein PK239_18835, partial [Chitinophagales bacterium]|nr:hypothetical protein [Chitinophagales bacterium]